MKVILSRKGFDSEYGGYPSPILPDGRMIFLPIPLPDDSACYSSLIIKYSNLNLLPAYPKWDRGW
jgi:hypothetical protein